MRARIFLQVCRAIRAMLAKVPASSEGLASKLKVRP